MQKSGFFNNKKILVTGGSGFIGSHLVKKLVTLGANVTVIDNLTRGKKENLLIGKDKYILDVDKKLIISDLTNYSVCVDIIKNFDYVFHLADVVGGIQYVFNNECYIFRQNITINSNTLAACIENKIPNYIYIGTACSFPKHLQSTYNIAYLKEEQTYPANPESSYGWSKLIGEYEAELAQSKKQINVGIIRAHNIYGPFSSFDKHSGQVIPSLIRKAILYPKENFIVWGSGKQYRDFIFVDDIISALIATAKRGMNKGVIQIGSGKATSIKELAEIIKHISKKNFKIIFDNQANEGDKGRVAIVTKAKEAIGWEPKTSIKEGLKQTYDWINSEMRK